MLEALLFDVDGTVAETEDVHRRAFNRAFAEEGIDLAWDAAEYRRLLAVPGGRARMACAFAQRGIACDEERLAALHARKTRAYQQLLRAEPVPWRRGVRPLMDEARRRGVRLALATTTTAANLDPLFAPAMGESWRARFAAVVAGDEVRCLKPAPDVYREALRRLGVRAEAAVAFEDSRAGVAAATAAGLTVIAAPSAWLPDDDLAAADRVVAGFDALTVDNLSDWHADLQGTCRWRE